MTDTTAETITVDEAVAIVSTLHSDTLSIAASDITPRRADSLVSAAKVQTTTELLLLLARFHADADDKASSDLLASFAVQFAAIESTVV